MADHTGSRFADHLQRIQYGKRIIGGPVRSMAGVPIGINLRSYTVCAVSVTISPKLQKAKVGYQTHVT